MSQTIDQTFRNTSIKTSNKDDRFGTSATTLGFKSNVMCPDYAKCTNSACTENHPRCKDYFVCKNEKCGFIHDRGKRYTRMKSVASSLKEANIALCIYRETCSDAECKKEHPQCRNGDMCQTTKCGFSHPNGKRFTKQLRSNAECNKEHPQCRNGDMCQTTKCGFSHPNGKRFTKQLSSRSDMTFYPIKEAIVKRIDIPIVSSIPLVPVSALKKTYMLAEMRSLDKVCIPENYSLSEDDKIPELMGVFTEVISAKGSVNSIQVDDEGEKFAVITVYPPSVRAYTELLEASRLNNAKLTGKSCNTLCAGDRVSFRLCLLNGQLHATCPRILTFNIKNQRTDSEVESLITIVLYDCFIDFKLFNQLLNISNTWSTTSIRFLVVAICNLMKKRAYIFTSTSFQKILLQSSIFIPNGVICRNLSDLSECELNDLKEMMGAIVMLNLDDSPLFVHIIKLIARRLCDANPSGCCTFLSDILDITLPCRSYDRIVYHLWWQLPSTLLNEELIFKGGKDDKDTSLNDLPSVCLGAPYATVETFISTYFRLHRADCYHQFREDIKVLRDEPGLDFAVFSRITVWGVQVSEVDAVVTMQLSVVPKNPTQLRYDCLKKESNQPCCISFVVKWCTDINHTTNGQLLDDLQSHYKTARLVENKASYVSYGPVLKALKSFWKPGCAMSIPFQSSLLSGQLTLAEDNEKYCEFSDKSKFSEIFDQWQLEAYNHAGLYSLALIQGPPGTGKSFLGARIARTLAECTERILVVTSKNHALDEILIDIANLYGPAGMSKIVRVGNNKKINDLLLPQTLQKLQEGLERSGLAITEQHKVYSQLKRACNGLSSSFIPMSTTTFLRATGEAGLNTLHYLLNPYNSTFNATLQGQRNLTHDEIERCDKYLSDWTEDTLSIIFEKIPKESDIDLSDEGQIYDIIANDNDVEVKDEIPRDSYLALINHFGLSHGNDSNQSVSEVAPKLFQSPPSEALVLMILRNEYSFLTSKFADLLKELKEFLDEESTRQTEVQVNILQSVPIIGATILGSILHIDAIAAATPTAIIIEEAGEVPEALLIALFSISSLKRCVMIGDYKQLRPSVNTYELAKHKHLDVSSFERLVGLEMLAPCLQTQNRMRLDVLLPVLQFYPDLRTNNDRIAHLLPVPWLPEPLFWWDCDSPGLLKDSSWYNDEQAKRVTELAKFLVSQGSVEEEKITILVPYTSQHLLVLTLLKKMGLTSIQCSSIDKYQGDENDIILLCLVRCNLDKPNKVGFLKTVSRIVVATSRQKRSLIIVGSGQCFRTHTEWSELITSLEGEVDEPQAIRRKRIDRNFPLRCPRHPHNFLKVPDSRCFPKGCLDGCQTLLECGHMCSMKCHPPSISHEKCQFLISHTYEPCGHTFELKCSEVNSICQQVGSVQLSCGHKKDMKCGLSKVPEELLCTSNKEIDLSCGHSMRLPCIVDEEKYMNIEFNPCFTCQLGNISDPKKYSIVRKLVQKIKSKNVMNKNEKETYIDGEGIAIINDSVIRLGLCKLLDSDVLDRLLDKARIPLSLLKSAIPPIEAWDHTISSNERMEYFEKYHTDQLLWRFLLQETGFKISKEWQENSLTLLSAMAIIETLDLSNYAKKLQSDAEIFAERLEILKGNGIVCAHDFFVILKEADDILYDALSAHNSSAKWYDTFESILAGFILKRLQTATANCCASKLNSIPSVIIENNEKKIEKNEIIKENDIFLQGNEKETVSEKREGIDLANEILKCAFKEKESEEISLLRLKWKLHPVCDIIAPPCSEIPHDFLYRRSFADSLYLSIDLKSADFHILKLAVPDLMLATSWGDLVMETVPELVEKIPFLPDLKSLRVRTLGKLFHNKNVALQGHCLRIITRVLLVMAQDMNHKSLFSCVDYVFHFSCDELCLRLSRGTPEVDAHNLSEAIAKVFIDNLGWNSLLPIRLEVFNLRMIPLSTLDDMGQHIKADDKEDGYTRLHYGHPLLRTSATFEDLPGVSEMSWREQPIPFLSKDERCDDYYFERNICVENSIAISQGAIKKLSFRYHPSVLLDRFKLNELLLNESARIAKLSAIAPEFKLSLQTPVTTDYSLSPLIGSPKITKLSAIALEFKLPSQTPVTTECLLSSKAVEFTPCFDHIDPIDDGDFKINENYDDHIGSMVDDNSTECLLSSKAVEYIPCVDYKDTGDYGDYKLSENYDEDYKDEYTDNVTNSDNIITENEVELHRPEYNFGLW